jgi:hypothetical protein
VEDAVHLAYEDIPAFPVSSAPGHNGVLILGMLAGAPVVLMQVYKSVSKPSEVALCTLLPSVRCNLFSLL